jgi:hypothetical protein
MAYGGTGAAGTLYAGNAGVAGALTPQVYRSANAGAVVVTWSAALVPPTGTLAAPGQLTYLALAPDYMSSNKVYAGTIGAESALSVSDDGGVYFYQAGLIDTYISNIQDFQAASATELFMVTANVLGVPAANATGGPESVWRSMDGGLSWYRIRVFGPAAGDTTNNTVILRLSPDYATDKTAYLAETGAGAVNMNLTNDGGNTWTGRVSPIAIADIAVQDQYTVYVGDAAAAGCRATLNGGWTWGPPGTVSAAATTVNDIEVDVGTGHIMAGLANGAVAISTDSNRNWRPQGAGPGGTAIVAFDTNYANNNIIYGADTTGVTAGVQRFNTSTPTVPWAVIDGGACVLPADILLAPDGTLYASDVTPSGGMVRSVTPTAPPIPGWGGVAASFEVVAGGPGGDGLTAGDILSLLDMAEGSNIIWAVNNLAIAPPVGPCIRTYTDTLTVAIPVLTGPADGTVFPGATTARLTWEGVAGARSHDYQFDSRADYATVIATTGTGAAAVPGIVNVAAPLVSATIGVGAQPALVPGRTYYWRVRVATPVMGPWSQSLTFETQLAPAAPNAPAVNVGPAVGGTAPGGYDAPLNPTFQWGNVPGSTGYEFQLAVDPLMEELIVDFSGDKPLGNTTAYQLTAYTLDYSTTYYWRVRAVSATSETAWSTIVAFTTMAEPEEPPAVTTQPPPTFTVTQPPQTTVVVDVPQPTTITVPPAEAPEEISPAYIWAIIIIGAVLVIAVIVLIVRTRRNV